MKLKKYISLLVLALAAGLTACNDNNYVEPLVAPAVQIEYIPTMNASEISLKLHPSRSVASFSYAIGFDNDLEAFQAGTLSGIRTGEGPEAIDDVFTGLNANVIYTIFATGYAENGTPGPLAMIKIKTRGPLADVTATPQFIGERSAAINIKGHVNYFKYVFALGRPGDKESFEKEVLDGIRTKEESSQYTATYFDLDMDSEYVFFLRAYDRLSNQPAETIEIPIHTAAKGTVGAVDIELKHIDLFNGDYIIKPNSRCKKFAVAATLQGEFEEAYENETFKGNVMELIWGWSRTNNTGYITHGYQQMFYQFNTPDLMLGTQDAFNYPIEIFVLIYEDEDEDPVNLQRFIFETPAYDDNAGEADVSIVISDIHDRGAMYEFILNEHAMGLVYETVDEEWYEELLKSGSYYEGYMEDLIYENGYWNYVHGVARTTFPEGQAQAGRNYKVFYMVMNHNGPFGGLSKMKSASYTTTGSKK